MLLISRALPSKQRNDEFEPGGKKNDAGSKRNEFAVSSWMGKRTNCVPAILGDIASPVCWPAFTIQRRLMDMRLSVYSLYYISIIAAENAGLLLLNAMMMAVAEQPLSLHLSAAPPPLAYIGFPIIRLTGSSFGTTRKLVSLGNAGIAGAA